MTSLNCTCNINHQRTVLFFALAFYVTINTFLVIFKADNQLNAFAALPVTLKRTQNR